MVNSLAGVAAEYVREHRMERQSLAISSDEPVALTVIQNRWAEQANRPVLGVDAAPATVMRAIENSNSGHELFSRVRDGKVVVFGLRHR